MLVSYGNTPTDTPRNSLAKYLGTPGHIELMLRSNLAVSSSPVRWGRNDASLTGAWGYAELVLWAYLVQCLEHSRCSGKAVCTPSPALPSEADPGGQALLFPGTAVHFLPCSPGGWAITHMDCPPHQGPPAPSPGSWVSA